MPRSPRPASWRVPSSGADDRAEGAAHDRRPVPNRGSIDIVHADRTDAGSQRGPVRVLALAIWCMLALMLLISTLTVEAVAFGVAVSVAVAIATAPFGDVVRPWVLLRPRTLAALALAVTVADSLVRIVRANVSLARRI